MSQALQLDRAFSSQKFAKQRVLPVKQTVPRISCSGVQQPREVVWRRGCKQRPARRAINVRTQSVAEPSAEFGGGGGKVGGREFGGGGGGGGGDDDGLAGNNESGGDSNGGSGWQGWKDRVAFDPEFPFKVFVEQVIGVGAAVLGDMSSRKDWGIHELDFVFSTVVVGSIMNFSLMYFLAGTKSASSSKAAGNIIARMFDENTLKRMGAPGGHFFEPGFPLAKRFLNLVYKGSVFGLVGFTAGIAGTSLSNCLIATRKRLDPKYEAQNESPAILPNAGVWAAHMGLSSNTRYQLLNGLDLILQPRMGAGAFKGLSTVIRLSNNVLGGMSFVTLAKLFGVQKSGDDA